MKIYGLSGKSGTGKSYNAPELCGKMNIEGLIDDGLFIYENSIVAGMSAKKQPTKIGAIKTALFFDDTHCNSVKIAIKRVNPESMLILGTSDKMVYEIAERLGLSRPIKIVHIEDITTMDQRIKARKLRAETGTHVIPAPTFQVKKQFSGYFLNTKKGIKAVGGNRNVTTEKTVVRPTYSYLGEYEISDKVITDIVGHMADISGGVSSVLWVATDNTDNGLYIRIILMIEYGAKIRKTALAIQRGVYDAVTYMTAFNVLSVEVEIRGLKSK